MDHDMVVLKTNDETAMVSGLSVEEAQAQFKKLQQFIKTQMRQDSDYGIIPGCKKNTLYKPGAEKLLYFHGLGVRLSSIAGETIADWKNRFFNFSYRAEVFNPRTGSVIATADGSCNSKEGKYAYRWLTENKLPKGTVKDELHQKTVPGKNGNFTLYRLDNDEICDIVNTLQKMAQKRAMVSAVLISCRASDIFTTEEEAEQNSAPSQTATTEKKEAPKPTGDVISDPQRKRLFAIQRGANVTDTYLRDYLKEKFPYTVDGEGKAHTGEIKRSDYETICNWLEEQKQ